MAYPLPRTPPRAAPSGQARLAIREYGSFAELPGAATALFDAAGETSFCLTRAWFEHFATCFIEPGERLSLLAAEGGADAGKPGALLIGRLRRPRQVDAGALLDLPGAVGPPTETAAPPA